MTSDRRAALVERVARQMYEATAARFAADPVTAELDGFAEQVFPPWDEVDDKTAWLADATAAIDLIRTEVLEEAAKVVRRMPSPSSEWMAEELLRALGGFANPVPDAIRAEVLEEAASVALEEYRRSSSGEEIAAAIRALKGSTWKCPINYAGCTKNCGSYGCGN